MNETISQLATANSVRWHGHDLRGRMVVMFEKGILVLAYTSEEERVAKKEGEEAGWGRTDEGGSKKERCSLLIKVVLIRLQ